MDSRSHNCCAGTGDCHAEAPATPGNIQESAERTDGFGPDCFVNRRTGFEPQGRLREGDSAGTGAGRPLLTVTTVTLEDRLLVALSRRGSRSLAWMIASSVGLLDSTISGPGCLMALEDLSDPALVEAFEREAELLGRTP